MKRNEIDKYLRHKMAFMMKENKRHTDYTPIFNEQIIALPRLIRLTRSSKEVPKNNIDGISKVLNLTHTELVKGVSCTISASTAYYSMSVAMLMFFEYNDSRCSGFSDNFYISIEESIKVLLSAAESQLGKCKMTRDDVLKLKEILKQLSLIESRNNKTLLILKFIKESVELVINTKDI
jgi:hypothetical protein